MVEQQLFSSVIFLLVSELKENLKSSVYAEDVEKPDIVDRVVNKEIGRSIKSFVVKSLVVTLLTLRVPFQRLTLIPFPRGTDFWNVRTSTICDFVAPVQRTMIIIRSFSSMLVNK